MIHTNAIYSRGRIVFRIDCNILQLLEAHVARRLFIINKTTQAPIQLLQIDEEKVTELSLLAGLNQVWGKVMYFPSVSPITLKVGNTGVLPEAFIDLINLKPFKYIANKRYALKYK